MERMPSVIWRGTLLHMFCMDQARSVRLCLLSKPSRIEFMLVVDRREFGIKRRPLRMDWARVRHS